MQAVAVCGIPDKLLTSLFESIASVWLILFPLDLLKGYPCGKERKITGIGAIAEALHRLEYQAKCSD